jgi:hypothetical protein
MTTLSRFLLIANIFLISVIFSRCEVRVNDEPIKSNWMKLEFAGDKL